MIAPPPVIVEGDSIAYEMQPAFRQIAPVLGYDARGMRTTATGVNRLLARRDIRGRIVIVSLGTNDYLAKTGVDIARYAHKLVKRGTRCVVWREVRVDAPNRLDGDGGAALNRRLRSVKGVHLVAAVRPDAGDGVHYLPDAAALQAKRLTRAAQRCA